MKRIGVFLSSKTGLPETYVRATRHLGEWIGRSERTLVYGGARKGLMEVLAQSVKQAGGRVVGVVPRILVERGLESEAMDVTFYTADLHDRKAALMRESDVVIALPGGIGTLDEVFTVLAARTIGTDRRLKVVLFNVDGCWNSLLAVLEDLWRQGLIDERVEQLVDVVADVAELEQILSA